MRTRTITRYDYPGLSVLTTEGAARPRRADAAPPPPPTKEDVWRADLQRLREATEGILTAIEKDGPNLRSPPTVQLWQQLYGQGVAFVVELDVVRVGLDTNLLPSALSWEQLERLNASLRRIMTSPHSTLSLLQAGMRANQFYAALLTNPSAIIQRSSLLPPELWPRVPLEP